MRGYNAKIMYVKKVTKVKKITEIFFFFWMKKGNFSTPKKQERSPKNKKEEQKQEEQKRKEKERRRHQEEEEREERPPPTVIFNDFVFVTIDSDKEEEEIRKELRFEIAVDRDDNKLVQRIYITLYDNDDIFFCMKCQYEPEDFFQLKENRYIIPFEGVAKEVIYMLRSIKNHETDYNVSLTIRGTHGIVTFEQNTPLFTKEMISFEFESIPEEEADEQAQFAYMRLSTRLDIAKSKLTLYNASLKKKNPDIYNDIMISGQDYAHTHEEKKRNLEQFLESNQKVSAGIAQMEQMKQTTMPKKLQNSPR